MVKTAESMAIEVVRLLILASQRPPIGKVMITVAAEVADFLNNRKRHEITRLEQDGKLSVQIVGVEEAPPEHLLIVCRDADDREVKFQ